MYWSRNVNFRTLDLMFVAEKIKELGGFCFLELLRLQYCFKNSFGRRFGCLWT